MHLGAGGSGMVLPTPGIFLTVLCSPVVSSISGMGRSKWGPRRGFLGACAMKLLLLEPLSAAVAAAWAPCTAAVGVSYSSSCCLPCVESLSKSDFPSSPLPLNSGWYIPFPHPRCWMSLLHLWPKDWDRILIQSVGNQDSISSSFWSFLNLHLPFPK